MLELSILFQVELYAAILYVNKDCWMKKHLFWSWRYGSEVKRPCCSARVPVFDSQNPFQTDTNHLKFHLQWN